jgi:2-polyprenyl-3-methyl-5-hydroxy-6-metoxy-1,4-benzoquinol methylase
MQRIVVHYVRPRPGDRLLDVGCGYGDLVEHLDGVDYVGIDSNKSYLQLAQNVHGAGGQFVHASVTDLGCSGLGQFDVAVAVGLLHHLPDDDATALLKALPGALKPGGRFIAAEPVFHPEQRATARVLAALDRGRYVRDQRSYEELVSPWFRETTTEIRHDLFWFPYSHCMVQATVAGP